MSVLDKYSERLRKLREKHAWESVNRPTAGSFSFGEAYAYAVGFQSGLNEAEKLVKEVLEEDKKGKEL